MSARPRAADGRASRARSSRREPSRPPVDIDIALPDGFGSGTDAGGSRAGCPAHPSTSANRHARHTHSPRISLPPIAPRAVQAPKPFSNGLAPRSPATRARISSKAASPAESQGKRRIGAVSTAFSGKESSHPLSGPRPGLIPGCRRGRPAGPDRAIPPRAGVSQRPWPRKPHPRPPRARPPPLRPPRPPRKAADTSVAARPDKPADTATAPKAAPKAANTPAPARPKPANRTVVYTALAETTGLGEKDVAAVFSALGELIAKELGKQGPWPVRRPRTPEAQGGAQARHQGAAGEEPIHRRADDDPGQACSQRRPGAAAEGPQGDGLRRGWMAVGGYRGTRQKVLSRLVGTALPRPRAQDQAHTAWPDPAAFSSARRSLAVRCTISR